jgi:hypothetical protein
MTDYEVAKFDLPHSYKAPLKADRDFDMKLYSIKSALARLDGVATRHEGVKNLTIKNEIALPKETIEAMIATIKIASLTKPSKQSKPSAICFATLPMATSNHPVMSGHREHCLLCNGYSLRSLLYSRLCIHR